MTEPAEHLTSFVRSLPLLSPAQLDSLMDDVMSLWTTEMEEEERVNADFYDAARELVKHHRGCYQPYRHIPWELPA